MTEENKNTEKQCDIHVVKDSLPEDSREFKEWQRDNNITRKEGTTIYMWRDFLYQREFFLEKFMEDINKAN